MHKHNGNRGKRFKDKIPVAHRIKRVGRGPRESQEFGRVRAVNGKRASRQGRGAQRTFIERKQYPLKTLFVSFQHFHVSQQMMRQKHGLRALKMCVPGDGYSAKSLGDLRE